MVLAPARAGHDGGMPRVPDPPRPPERLAADVRREALLDIARALVEEGGLANVTMATVAERAEVTRTLVYKHFANRDAILGALYQREAAALDGALRRQVAAAPDGFEPKLRAFAVAVAHAADTRAQFFVPLRPFGRTADQRQTQRSWDSRTSTYFATLAAEEFGLDRKLARSAVAVLLSGIVAQLTQPGTRRPAGRRDAQIDLYVRLAVGALEAVAEGR
jgi:AcrR family transcriptional regulator